MRRWALVLLIILVCAGAAQGVGPSVTNVVARQVTDGTGRVEITYNLADPDSATVYVSVQISTDGAPTYCLYYFACVELDPDGHGYSQRNLR